MNKIPRHSGKSSPLSNPTFTHVLDVSIINDTRDEHFLIETNWVHKISRHIIQ